MLHVRTFPAGFIAPCLPTKADTLPSGGLWIHEIKHDGFRIIARKDGERIRLYSRPGKQSSATIMVSHPSTTFAIGAMMATYSSTRSTSSN